MSETIQPVEVGGKFGQITVTSAGIPQVREIEITRRPTLSTPARYVVTRNDAHPHRVGKSGRITRGELARKYREVTA